MPLALSRPERVFQAAYLVDVYLLLLDLLHNVQYAARVYGAIHVLRQSLVLVEELAILFILFGDGAAQSLHLLSHLLDLLDQHLRASLFRVLSAVPPRAP